jgi:hypothetical protein
MKLIANLLNDFNTKKGYFTGDQKMNEYFKANYSNKNVQETFLKVTAMDDNFSRQLKKGLLDFSLYISKLKLDHHLELGQSEAVDLIMQYPDIKNNEDLLEFASTYCNIHNNDAFPIYHDMIFKLLNDHLNNINQLAIFSYSQYALDMILFREQLGLGKLNFMELNKFLWLYSDRIFLSDRKK